MVERKRRNDFVRKRELDTLRKLRRDGLSPEQLAALGGSSRSPDSEVRQSESAGARADVGVKAKIDEIEQQMVGEQSPREPLVRQRPPARRAPAVQQHRTDFYTAPTEPADLEGIRPGSGMLTPGFAPAHQSPSPQPDAVGPLPILPGHDFLPPVAPRGAGVSPQRNPPAGVVSTWAPGGRHTARPPTQPGAPLPDLDMAPVGGTGLPRSDSGFDPSSRFAVEQYLNGQGFTHADFQRISLRHNDQFQAVQRGQFHAMFVDRQAVFTRLD